MSGHGIAVVTVNYNTHGHIARLLYSLRTRGGDALTSVVVVDNGSTDGSVELLESAAAADLCELLTNSENRYHGPALNQAIDYVARHHPECRYVWILDSDCVVLRDGLATAVRDVATTTGAALVGECIWDRWHKMDRLAIYSLFVDLQQIRSVPDAVFAQDGDPAYAFEVACRTAGLTTAEYPFTKALDVVHVGRGSLREVVARDERSNEYFDWATDHHAPHFQEVPGAAEAYAAFCAEFENQNS